MSLRSGLIYVHTAVVQLRDNLLNDSKARGMSAVNQAGNLSPPLKTASMRHPLKVSNRATKYNSEELRFAFCALRTKPSCSHRVGGSTRSAVWNKTHSTHRVSNYACACTGVQLPGRSILRQKSTALPTSTTRRATRALHMYTKAGCRLVGLKQGTAFC